MQKSIDLMLGLCGIAVGVIMNWIPHTRFYLSASLILIFGLLCYPVWNFWWIEKSLWLRAAALLFLASCLCVFGYFVYPEEKYKNDNKANQKIVKNHTKTEPPQPLALQLPSTGNLKQRAIDLSEEIMRDLYRHGWNQELLEHQGKTPAKFVVQQMPTDPEGSKKWVKSRSRYFRFRLFKKVLALRNEFSRLHFRDNRLDDFFRYQGMIQDANRQLAATQQSRQIDTPILPQEIEEIAERLKILAEQLK